MQLLIAFLSGATRIKILPRKLNFFPIVHIISCFVLRRSGTLFQSGPEVAGSDDDESAGFQFAVKPDQDEEFLANQVEDDAIDQSQKAPHPLVRY